MPGMLLFFFLQRHKRMLRAFGKCLRKSLALLWPVTSHLIIFISTAQWNFSAPLAIRFLSTNNCARWRSSCNGLSQAGGRVDFSMNLCASTLQVLWLYVDINAFLKSYFCFYVMFILCSALSMTGEWNYLEMSLTSVSLAQWCIFKDYPKKVAIFLEIHKTLESGWSKLCKFWE